ncbi:MAG: DivIVA domain-containing protein [Ignavibacteria bacterium]|nr:DivIVA domain-containing protein [Ignavibacteria bacterium]MBK7158310.1 DivIVA domain-containing protein [Ignavibacteria bacterium]MBK7254298.1 DivIVA domain-containing protein [Ignavibacteria bacterium]MBK7446463.1 DivIVA domain-containing protein [Ignavibacteria bacterium]MBK9405058.1 DivIVA domain-containing protein [Ignavibacteria bacterium]
MSIISPKDIKKNDFKKNFRGYDPNEVDAFLETVSLRYERLFEENSMLTEKVKSLTSDVDVYKENESTLQKAIVKTQDMSEEIIANAKKRAENIIKEAELNSQKVMQEVDKDIMTKKQELEEMKLRNDKLVEDVKLFFLEKLNEMDEFIKNRNIYSMELANIAATNDENMNSNEDEDLSKLKKVSISTARTNFSD